MTAITAFDRLIDAFREHGNTVTVNGDKATAQCPSHDDGRASLSIGTRRDGKGLVVYCHAGCRVEDIVAAAGLAMTDLFDDPRMRAAYNGHNVYDYPDGRKVHRKPGKQFHQSGNTKGTALFHADRIGDVETVYIAEGEKDVLAIEAIGAVAVCSAMGAGKAHLADWTPLTDKHAIIVADNDKPGHQHARQVAEQLDGIAATTQIKVVAVGKDAADHIAAGKTLDELVSIEADDDPDPVPLTQTVHLRSFPVDSLPAPVAAMVNAVAEATQTDPAMAGASALSTLAACAGGHAEIEIRSGWREPLCLYTATVAEPGERKSAVQQAMIRPILDVERQMTETMMPARMEAEARRQIAIKAMEKEFRTAANAKADEADAATADAIGAAAAANVEVPPVPRLVADDVTPEAVGTLLSEQKGRLAIMSAEGGIFDIIAGRYSGSVPNLDVWLKGHSGDMIRIDRKGRPPEYILRPALTLGLMIQPEVLKTIAAQRTFRGRGLLVRFLYALPESRVGHRRIGSDPLPEPVRAAYDTHVQALATGMAEWLSDPAVLMLAPAAHEAMQAIEVAVEPTLADDGELASLKDWGSKYVGAVARIAGIVHLSELGSERGPITPVSAETIQRAAAIGAYFKAAAIGAFLVMATDPGIADAVYLLGRIRHLGNDTVSERELHRACQSRFPKKDGLLAAIDRLVEHGYLIPQQTSQQNTKGRPASPTYKVHTAAKQ